MINSIHAIKHHHQGLQPSNGEEKFIARIKAVFAMANTIELFHDGNPWGIRKPHFIKSNVK